MSPPEIFISSVGNGLDRSGNLRYQSGTVKTVPYHAVKTTSCKTKAKGGKDVSSPPKAFLLALFNVYDLTAIVLTAGLASTMGHTECAAAGALYDAGDSELPCGRTSLITSLS